MRLRDRLPRGGTLPEDEFERRHEVLLRGLWASIAVVAVYGGVRGGIGALHAVGHVAPLLSCALLARARQVPARLRAVALSFGLLTAAAIGVHLSGGVTEAHFSFFVIVVALTFYEDWWPFLLAVVFVALHHGILGMVDPHAVFEQPSQYAHPWRWAGIHAVFIACGGGVGMMGWRLNEGVRQRMRDAQLELERAANTDALTGLGARRLLMADLDVLVAGATPQAPVTVAIFDLDGFKTYNDTFGHLAGDALLQRVATRLVRAAGDAQAYRLGGDEFCLLIPAAGAQARRVTAAALAALSEEGDAFCVRAAFGAAVVPAQAGTATEALRIADEAMYDRKKSGPRSPAAQSTRVLTNALDARHPDLGHQLDVVAGLSWAVARKLGLPPGEVRQIVHAAELHDVGKVAVPESILGKPGALDDAEWAFVKRHTVIGERIVSGAPDLALAAKLVRSSHEHWDGGGYPDALRGQEIPMGARIISACNALDAMCSTRPYQPARTREEALAELRRCAGTQFDPAVVAALDEVVRELHDDSERWVVPLVA